MALFSQEELRDIVIAVLVITLIFSVQPLPNLGINFDLVPTFFLVVIIAFLFHELAHRFVARKFGCVAFFKLWPTGILFGLLFMLVGLKFVAPGAVVIYPYRFGRWKYRWTLTPTHTEMGLIATSGPLVNITFAALFSIFTGGIFGFLAFINAWLAFFNLLPVPPLDGSKIFMWKPWFWLFLFILSGALLYPYMIGSI